MKKVLGKRGIYFTMITISLIIIFGLIAGIIASQKKFSSQTQSVSSRAQNLNALSDSIEKDLERALYISMYRSLLGINDMIRNASSYNNQPEFVPYGQVQWYTRRMMMTATIPIIEYDVDLASIDPLDERLSFLGVTSEVPEESKFVIRYKLDSSGELHLITGQQTQAMIEGQEENTLPSWVSRIKKKTELSGVGVSMSIKRVDTIDPGVIILDESDNPVSESACLANTACANAAYPYEITLTQYDYYTIQAELHYDLNLTDKTSNTSITIRDKPLIMRTELTNLPDPMYTGFTGGKLHNSIQLYARDTKLKYYDLTNCTQGYGSSCTTLNVSYFKEYLNGPTGHSSYRLSQLAPSYLQRFEGRTFAWDDTDLNPGKTQGIESIVNLRTVATSGAGIEPLNKVSIDWIYFNHTTIGGVESIPDICSGGEDIGCAFPSNPVSYALDVSAVTAEGGFADEAAWIKLDCCGLHRYSFLNITAETPVAYEYFVDNPDPSLHISTCTSDIVASCPQLLYSHE